MSVCDFLDFFSVYTLCIFNYQTSKSLWSSEVLTGDAHTLPRTVVIESSHSETSLTAGICTTASPLSSICFFDVAAHLQTPCLRCNITACTWSHARRTHPCKPKPQLMWETTQLWISREEQSVISARRQLMFQPPSQFAAFRPCHSNWQLFCVHLHRLLWLERIWSGFFFVYLVTQKWSLDPTSYIYLDDKWLQLIFYRSTHVIWHFKSTWKGMWLAWNHQNDPTKGGHNYNYK